MASTACDQQHLQEYVLRCADTPLILGQRLGELVGGAPTLEEETAIANTALDLLGQAQLLLEYAGTLEGSQRSADSLAFVRHQHEFRNLLIVERPVADFAEVIARNLYACTWISVLWESLLDSTDTTLAAIAAKARKESAYHVRHAIDWTVRLGDGTDESTTRMTRALQLMWPFAGEAFMGDVVDDEIAAHGIAPHCTTLESSWRTVVGGALDAAGMSWPEGSWSQSGGKQGRHTEALGYVLAEMQYLQRAFPGASW